jgi:hypothetical protein
MWRGFCERDGRNPHRLADRIGRGDIRLDSSLACHVSDRMIRAIASPISYGRIGRGGGENGGHGLLNAVGVSSERVRRPTRNWPASVAAKINTRRDDSNGDARSNRDAGLDKGALCQRDFRRFGVEDWPSRRFDFPLDPTPKFGPILGLPFSVLVNPAAN